MVKAGELYKHYKRGYVYKILMLAKDADTHEEIVVYQGLYDDPQFGNNPLWVRPRKEFEEYLEKDGKQVKRFTKVIDKLAWIHIKDKKILSTRSIGKDTYYIPGGKREGNETDEQALTREIKEELNVSLKQETIKHVGTFEAQAHGKKEGIIVRMTCYTAQHEGNIKPSNEIEEIAWFTHKDKERSSAVDKIIFDWLKEKKLIN